MVPLVLHEPPPSKVYSGKLDKQVQSAVVTKVALIGQEFAQRVTHSAGSGLSMRQHADCRTHEVTSSATATKQGRLTSIFGFAASLFTHMARRKAA